MRLRGLCRISILITASLTMLLAARMAGAAAASGQNVAAAPRRWNPVNGPPAGAKYVGDALCAECHVAEAKYFFKTPMEQAGARAQDARVLQKHPKLSVRLGPYTYRIVRQDNQEIYMVSDGARSISVPLLWAFGEDMAGQTYVYRQNGSYYQSAVSFYRNTESLDVTMGVSADKAYSLKDALGSRMIHPAALRCIGCHTTGAVVGGQLHARSAVPGVHCEACHGPGGAHIAALQAGNIQQAKAAIFNPGRLSAVNLDRFCGACHRTGTTVVSKGIFGVLDVRFQPYRLGLSRCWSPTDKRISCLACHNPHQPLVTDERFYDSKCLACHQEKGAPPLANHPGPACPVATSRCVSCHMPRYQLPGGHFAFTDHDIRVVRPGAPYPG